ncbi:MAG: hypothetical protein ACLQVK_21565 [Acidimicrobiales bacterium]|jgi:hypothetical protein
MSTYVKPYDRRSRPRRVISNTALVIAVLLLLLPLLWGIGSKGRGHSRRL